MATQDMDFIAPLATPLPPLPDTELLTPSQWTTLLAIGDTVIPRIEVSSSNSTENLTVQASEYATLVDKLKQSRTAEPDTYLPRKYLEENATSVSGLKDNIQRILGDYVREDARKGIRVILSALNTRPGCLLTTGSTTLFHLQPVHVRQQILLNWSRSYLPPLRQSFKALTLLFASVWIRRSPTLGTILGYPQTPVHGKRSKGFNYDFIQFSPGSEPEIIETDVIIIGSGCGAGPSAKNIAEAGKQVIVVEKSYHYPPEHLPMAESDAGVHLIMNGGVDPSDDSSISIVAAQAFGGGGTVNWSASLQTQGFVRKEWADAGLSFFTSSEYQKSLDRVCHRMGVSAEQIEHNKTNRVLLDGARKLGYSAKAVAQNTGGKKHYCGYCSNGCGAVEKQGPAVSFLPDAARAGAKFIEGFNVEKVLFEEINGQRVAATGVQGRWTSRDSHGGVSGTDRFSREIIIKAQRVIVSAGTMQSPLLLLRSGLKNAQIGRNLHLHPASFVGATFPEEVRPWEGGILTTVCDEFQNLDGHGHGVKLEATAMLPGMFLTFQPWVGGMEYKMLCSKFKNMCGYISLVRDRDTGRVYPDPVDGRCRTAYTPSAFDKKHCMEGLLAMAKICYVAGAREIFTSTFGVSTFVREDNDVLEGQPDPGVNDPSFQTWLEEVRRKGLHVPEAMFASAHQMGTCRMGTSEKSSVVDPSGKVWGCEGLYVADASVFPSASGVNPMITTMAISDWISRGVVKGLRGEERLEGKARL